MTISFVNATFFGPQILENYEIRRTGDISAGFRPPSVRSTSQNHHSQKEKEGP